MVSIYREKIAGSQGPQGARSPRSARLPKIFSRPYNEATRGLLWPPGDRYGPRSQGVEHTPSAADLALGLQGHKRAAQGTVALDTRAGL